MPKSRSRSRRSGGFSRGRRRVRKDWVYHEATYGAMNPTGTTLQLVTVLPGAPNAVALPLVDCSSALAQLRYGTTVATSTFRRESERPMMKPMKYYGFDLNIQVSGTNLVLGSFLYGVWAVVEQEQDLTTGQAIVDAAFTLCNNPSLATVTPGVCANGFGMQRIIKMRRFFIPFVPGAERNSWDFKMYWRSRRGIRLRNEVNALFLYVELGDNPFNGSTDIRFLPWCRSLVSAD